MTTKIAERKATFKKLTPVLAVEDVAKTVEYYEKVLGFSRGITVPDAPPFVFASVSAGEIEIMFQQKDSLVQDLPVLKGRVIGNCSTLYLEVEGLRALYDSLKRNRATIVKDLHKTFYGTEEFYISDSNGYVLGFTEKA